MKKNILLLGAILALSSAVFGASSSIVNDLEVIVSGDLKFGNVVIPDSGIATKTIAANASEGVTVAFIGTDSDETVSVTLNGSGISGTELSADDGAVKVKFFTYIPEADVTQTWKDISTRKSFYIGGTRTVSSTTTGNTDFNEGITVTVTYDSIS